jgi:hypothetical protein
MADKGTTTDKGAKDKAKVSGSSWTERDKVRKRPR